MLYTEHKGNTLAVASGDGCLSVFDLRAGRLLARSDQQDDELLSLALLKGGRKLVCGCQVCSTMLAESRAPPRWTASHKNKCS